MSNSNYEDNILIKLRRTYSKDETVSLLFKKFSEMKKTIGQYQSEVLHLQHVISEYKKQKDKSGEIKTLQLNLKASSESNKRIKERIKLLKFENEFLIKELNKIKQ